MEILIIWLTWLLYIACMQLKRAWNNLHIVAKIMAAPAVAIAIVLDVIINVYIATFVFLDIPQELLLTTRLKRMKRDGKPWQKRIASWVCDHLLNQFDAGGHC